MEHTTDRADVRRMMIAHFARFPDTVAWDIEETEPGVFNVSADIPAQLRNLMIRLDCDLNG